MAKKFYEDGLRFDCTRCSACCRHDSGYVFLSPADLSRIADSLGQSESEVVSQYCVTVNGAEGRRISLKEKANKDCIMWRAGSCSIYAARPTQCRTFPFWPRILESSESWNDAGRSCPGINTGKLHSAPEIEGLLAQHKANRDQERDRCG